MTDTIQRNASKLSPAGEWLFACVCWLTGLAILALATDVIHAASNRIETPRWVIGTAGALFLAGGFVPLATRWHPDSWPARAVGAGVLWPLAVIFNWIAFGPGERHFRSSLSIAGAVIPERLAERSGRAIFGLIALTIDVMVVAVAVRWFSRGSRPHGS